MQKNKHFSYNSNKNDKYLLVHKKNIINIKLAKKLKKIIYNNHSIKNKFSPQFFMKKKKI